MRTVTVELVHGLTVGEITHTEAVIREATVGDMLDATERAERLVQTADGPQLVASPTRVGFLTLLTQIERIGDVEAVTEQVARGLHPEDLDILQAAADGLTSASASREVARRGRAGAQPG